MVVADVYIILMCVCVSVIRKEKWMKWRDEAGCCAKMWRRRAKALYSVFHFFFLFFLFFRAEKEVKFSVSIRRCRSPSPFSSFSENLQGKFNCVHIFYSIFHFPVMWKMENLNSNRAFALMMCVCWQFHFIIAKSKKFDVFFFFSSALLLLKRRKLLILIL